MAKPAVKVEIGGVGLKNPLVASSGTFGYGTEYSGLAGIECFGAVVLKGITLKPRKGNPPPRIFETPCGLLNSIGLENCGISAFISEKLPEVPDAGTAIIANLTGNEKEVRQMLRMLEGTKVKAAEINLSCPNIKGEIISCSPELSGNFVSAVRQASRLPVWVKLSPAASDIGAVARACQESGADALTLINTFPAMGVDIERMKPVLGNITGGLSGPAVKPIALKLVWDACRAVKIPVIGGGGIMTASDAIEFILCGAHAVSIGTGIFSTPEDVNGIAGGIEDYLLRKGFNDVSELKGRLDVS